MINEVINRCLVQFPGHCRCSISAIYLFPIFHTSDPHNNSMLSGRNFCPHLADEKIEARNTGQKDDSHLDFNGQPNTPRKTWLLFFNACNDPHPGLQDSSPLLLPSTQPCSFLGWELLGLLLPGRLPQRRVGGAPHSKGPR